MSCWSIAELTAGALACSGERSVSVVLNAGEAFVLDDFGGAEFPLSSSFDYYPFETLNQRWKGNAKLLVFEDFWINLFCLFFCWFKLLGKSPLKAESSVLPLLVLLIQFRHQNALLTHTANDVIPTNQNDVAELPKLKQGVYRIATLLASRRLAPTSFTRKSALQTVGRGRSSIRSTTGINLPPSICTRRSDGFCHGRNILVAVIETSPITRQTDDGGAAVGGGRITDSARKNQLVVVSVQYGPFYTYIPIRSTTIGKSRVAIDPIAMNTSWRSNSDIASVTSIGYPHMKASGESSTSKHRLLHASGPHPIPPPNDPKLFHSTNGNHLESPNEGSSIDHQVTIHLNAQNITMFPTNETWYFALQMLVSSSGGLILISRPNRLGTNLECTLVVASAEEHENDIRTATEDDQQQLRNLFIVIHFRSGGSISWLNTQHDTWNSN
ncbi:hypothetical protein F511_35374 [Dorcoceras hygrometricum]|uniref:Uncharacterized protein n=1 Tax=Dorcoceras hygrometricum TaxID=472368 RepID=A0A2Z7ADP5_9LAMI|nr:hypothetical protein F511_35374 [Dorcoceras hygrometricum]